MLTAFCLLAVIAYGLDKFLSDNAVNAVADLAFPLRCRYSDCAEQHPEACEDEQVTCSTCREDLALPPLSNDPSHAGAVYERC